VEAYTTNDDNIEIVIWDTGRGVMAADYERIFDPFFTRKSKTERTGLGLYICMQIVRDLRGELFVSQHEGGGAQFTVRLPVKKG
jgi:signal transduction histidine kinase